MEKSQRFSWLEELPNEILREAFDNLGRLHLNSLVRVNKRLRAMAQYVLEHKKKIRLCGNNLRVLVLALPSKYDPVTVGPDVVVRGPHGVTNVASRAVLLINTFVNGSWIRISNMPVTNQIVARCYPHKQDGIDRRITMIQGANDKRYRQKLWINTVAADLCLFIVDPEEIDTHSEEIKELIFGSCFMMSARNVIVAVDLHNYSTTTEALQPFNQARTKMSKLLERTVGMCFKIIPVNVKTGSNIDADTKPKYEWFSGPCLRKLILDDQLRTNLDELAYKRLCEEPLKIQLSNCHRIGGIGTVPVGRVLSGVLKPRDSVMFHPHGQTSEVPTIEEYHEVTEARPGDVIGFNVRRFTRYEIGRRLCYAVSTRETKTVNCTFAFRASIVVMNSDRFTQHQVYNVFYGTSRIRCVLWWIFPEGGNNKNHDRDERKFKIESLNVPTKPVKGDMKENTYKLKLREYKLEVAKEKERHRNMQANNGTGYIRPPKQKLKKATAILLPLVHFDIETYKPTEFEKNYRGKVMLTEKGSIIGVGRVDRVLSYSSETFKTPTNRDYREQYSKVVSQASELFNLPTEQKMLELFLDHVTSNKHAKKSIQRQKSKSKL